MLREPCSLAYESTASNPASRRSQNRPRHRIADVQCSWRAMRITMSNRNVVVKLLIRILYQFEKGYIPPSPLCQFNIDI